MKNINSARRWRGLVLQGWAALGLAGLTGLTASAATTTNVNVGDDFFSPATVGIHSGDSVKWTWVGSISHSSTSRTSLWNSGVHGNGFTFTNKFNTVGSFPYLCTVHPSIQTGTINVAVAVNTPPTVAITFPTNGAVFAAPWSGLIQATDADSDGTVTNLEFHAGTLPLGTVANPPASVSFQVTNLAAGSYSLAAIATDNAGASTTSTGVAITVVDTAPLTLSGLSWPSVNTFQFNYSATPGLSYVVRRATVLGAWTSLSTNTATTSSVTFVDNAPPAGGGFYSVYRLANP